MSKIDFGTNIMNPQIVPATAEEFWKQADSEKTQRICAELADLLEQNQRGQLTKSEYGGLKTELKRRSSFITPHAHFGGGYKASDKQPEDSGKALLDIDNYGAGIQLFDKCLRGRERELGINAAYTTVSGNGFAILFDRPVGLSIPQAQAWMAHLLGDVPYDKGVHDLTRAAYIPCREYIVYLDEELMFGDELHPAQLSDEELARWQQLEVKTPAEPATTQTQVQPVAPVGATKRTLFAFDETLKTVGLTLEQLNSIGVRHNILKLLLPTLCQMMTEAELLGVLQERMTDYSREADCSQLVHDFYLKYVDSARPMTLKQRELFLRSLNVQPVEDEAAESQQAQQSTFITRRELTASLQASLRPYPDSFIMPQLVGMMPALMALADGVTYRYCDGKIHHLGGMSIIMAEQSGYKSTIKDVVEMWIAQLRSEDDIVREKEDRARNRNKLRKQTERGEEAPTDVVRTLPISVSCAKLLKRLKQAQGHTLYSICEEIDTLRKTNGAGSWSAKYDIYRVAFDHSRWGTDYNSDQSESGEVEVGYNWTVMGTRGSVEKCFAGDNVENGLSSRVMLSKMPDNMFAPITVFKDWSDADKERIRLAAAKLRAAQGFIDTPRIRKAINQWLEEKRIEAAKAADRIKDIYRRRAAVIGFRCGVVYMLLKGQETNGCLNFAQKMAEYTLQQQQAFFGPLLMKRYMRDAENMLQTSVNGNIYAELPNPFKIEDLRRVKGKEFPDGTLYSIISRWKKEGWIEKTGKDSWTKLLKQ